MALQLDITSPNGIETRYHRIASYTPDFDRQTITVVLLSYAAESYRDQERDQQNAEKLKEAIREQLSALVSNPTDENEAERIELSEQLNELDENQQTHGKYHAMKRTHELGIPEGFEYTRAAVYALLTAEVYPEATEA